MKDIFNNFISFITSRIFILSIAISVMFGFMIFKLFNLQIVNGEEYLNTLQTYILREIPIPAPRGTIYDRYGRPLAINNVAYSVKIDSSELDESIKYDNAQKNSMYMDLINLIEKNGDAVIDELPISKTRPYTFLFNGDVKKEVNWKLNDINYTKNIDDDFLKNSETKKAHWQEIQDTLAPITAEQIMEYLKSEKMFGIDPKLNEDDARKLISLRYSLYLQRWKQFQSIAISLDVSDKTVAMIEEQSEKYKGVNIETESLRVYPEKGLLSHILGYTRGIDSEEYEEYRKYVYQTDEKTGEITIVKQDKYDESGEHIYSRNDIVGKTGLEKSMELELNGMDGRKFVETDAHGKRVKDVNTKKEAIAGKKVFLSIDRDLQEVVSNAILEQLKATILLRLSPVSSSDKLITLKEVFSSMSKSNFISFDQIINSEDGSYQALAKNILIREGIATSNLKSEELQNARKILSNAVEAGELSPKQMLLILHEQGKISGDENFVMALSRGSISPINVLKDKIINNEITPQDMNLRPCSGSATVTDISTGKVLAMVGYPTYDNNELVNEFNNEYYTQLLNDPTTPLTHRPLHERKAPGSTFKMVTSLAVLEEGIITPYTTIHDQGSFDKAGWPPAKCWLYGSRGTTHGSINVIKAIEVSCNYFFYESSYRLGSSENRLQGIHTLNKYMKEFGLGDKTGVEIGETNPIMATPEVKKSIEETKGSNNLNWSDGDTIRAAIGQSYNSYTTANMSKYIATLANGGTRYKMSLIDSIVGNDNNIEYKEPVIEEELSFKKENLDAVYEGMHNVTRGKNGTLTAKFKDYPIEIGAKTGTAQEANPDHTWCVAFAPFENPQISIAVMFPFGDATNYPAAEVIKTVITSYMGTYSQSETKTMNNILSK